MKALLQQACCWHVGKNSDFCYFLFLLFSAAFILVFWVFVHMAENMVTNNFRILHLTALVTGERLTQLSKSQIPKILGNALTSWVRLRYPFLNQSTTDWESGSQHNNANCVDSRGRGQVPDYGHWCLAGNFIDVPDSKPSFPDVGYECWVLSNRPLSSLRHWGQILHIWHPDPSRE